MSLAQLLRVKLKESQKNNWTFAKNLLKVVIGEVDTIAARNTGKPFSDEDVQKIIRKMIVSNKETMDSMKKVGRDKEDRYALLEEENVYLSSLLPKTLTVAEIQSKLIDIAESIRSVKSDGQATGIGIKYLKSKSLSFLSDDVASVVKLMRA
jgi:uncharacterized protein YqeY